MPKCQKSCQNYVFSTKFRSKSNFFFYRNSQNNFVLGFITSVTVVGINQSSQNDKENKNEYKAWISSLLFIIPMCVMGLVVFFNYWCRRQNSHDLARRYYRWHAVLQAYITAQIYVSHTDNTYDSDQECTWLWNVCQCCYFREFASFFWTYISLKLVDNICIAITMVMIYLSAQQALNGHLSTGQFIAIAGSYLSLVSIFTAFTNFLNQKPTGYEAILRIGQVLNNSELKTAYDQVEAVGGLKRQGNTFIDQVVDVNWLKNLDLRNLHKKDVKKLFRMSAFEMEKTAIDEEDALEEHGVDKEELMTAKFLTGGLLGQGVSKVGGVMHGATEGLRKR